MNKFIVSWKSIQSATDGSERTLNVVNIAGDKLGTLHVGQTDIVDIMLNTTTYIPFNVRVYQVSYTDATLLWFS